MFQIFLHKMFCLVYREARDQSDQLKIARQRASDWRRQHISVCFKNKQFFCGCRSIRLPQVHHISPFNEYGEVKRARRSPKLTTFLWMQENHWSFSEEKKEFRIQTTTPRLNSQQSMSQIENKRSKWEHVKISLSTYTSIFDDTRLHFSALRTFEEYSWISSISDTIMWTTQRDIAFTTRMEIPRVLSNEIVPSPRRTSSLFYQWNIIIPSTELHYHYLTNG